MSYVLTAALEANQYNNKTDNFVLFLWFQYPACLFALFILAFSFQFYVRVGFLLVLGQPVNKLWMHLHQQVYSKQNRQTIIVVPFIKSKSVL